MSAGETDRYTDRSGERYGGKKRKIEISKCKYKEYKKAKSFIWMF